MADGANVIKNLPEILRQAFGAAIDVAKEGMKGIAGDVKGAIDDFKKKVMEVLNKEDLPKDFFDQFFGAIEGMQFAPNAFRG
jgi:hypothetical protein